MTNHPIDEAAERRKFERIISAPPYEHMCDTNGRSSAWLGQYKRYETQLAWELWLARARIAADELASLRAEVEKYRGGMPTHADGCWSWGWRHYECAEREIARLRSRVAELEAGEPVAWLYRAVDDGTTFASTTKPEKEDAYYTHQPLYTAPPQPEGWRPIETAPKEQWVIVYGERTASCPAYVTFAWLTPQGEWRDWYWESMESRPPDLWSACPDRALAGGGT